MPLILPETLESRVQPIFEVLPLEEAMRNLVVDAPLQRPRALALVEAAVDEPELADRHDLVAGLWLYVDELDRSHAVSQNLHTPTGSYWHAIMHRREGEFSNAKYWYRRTGNHPAMSRIDLTGGGAGAGTSVAQYDAADLVDRVERAHQRDDRQNPALLSAQHKEWLTLFNWCVENQ